jgi:hypothetical protein
VNERCAVNETARASPSAGVREAAAAAVDDALLQVPGAGVAHRQRVRDEEDEADEDDEEEEEAGAAPPLLLRLEPAGASLLPRRSLRSS